MQVFRLSQNGYKNCSLLLKVLVGGLDLLQNNFQKSTSVLGVLIYIVKVQIKSGRVEKIK